MTWAPPGHDAVSGEWSLAVGDYGAMDKAFENMNLHATGEGSAQGYVQLRKNSQSGEDGVWDADALSATLASLPPWGSEVFIAGLVPDVSESNLREMFESIGPLFQIRIPRDLSTGFAKGFAFVRFHNKEDAKTCCRLFHQSEFKGSMISVVISEDNRTLFIGNIRKQWTRDFFEKIIRDKIENIIAVTIHCEPSSPERNRGFAFVELDSHQSAGRALAKMRRDDFNLEGIFVDVSWARPMREPDEDSLANVKAVYAANLSEEITDEIIGEIFGKFGNVEKIILAGQIPMTKRRDFAFVHFSERESALKAIQELNGETVLGKPLELSLRRPVERSVVRAPRSEAAISVGFKTKLCRFFIEGQCSKADLCPFAHGEEELRNAPENIAANSTATSSNNSISGGSDPVSLASTVANFNGGGGGGMGRAVMEESVPFEELVKRMAQKTRLCAFWEEGACAKGSMCNFAHGINDLRREARFNALRQSSFGESGGAAIGVTEDPRPIFFKTKLCQFFEQGKCAKGEGCPYAHGYSQLRSQIQLAYALRPAVDAMATPLPLPLSRLRGRPDDLDSSGDSSSLGIDVAGNIHKMLLSPPSPSPSPTSAVSPANPTATHPPVKYYPRLSPIRPLHTREGRPPYTHYLPHTMPIAHFENDYRINGTGYIAGYAAGYELSSAGYYAANGVGYGVYPAAYPNGNNGFTTAGYPAADSSHAHAVNKSNVPWSGERDLESWPLPSVR